jgi:hypothetical protein
MKFKKGDLVLVVITPDIAAKMPHYLQGSKRMKGKIACRMGRAKVPSYRVDFNPFCRVQVPCELVSEFDKNEGHLTVWNNS